MLKEVRNTAARFCSVLSGCLGLVLASAALAFQTASSGPVLTSQRSVSAVTPICAVQGKGFSSPYAGETVLTHGVVYADLDQTSKRGFFMQAEGCDGIADTSDGIFVYLGASQDVVEPGDLVEVSGLVQEYYGMTEISTSADGVRRVSGGNPLPAPVDLAPPFDNAESDRYLESLQGMYVRLDQASVVGPTSQADETWVIRSDLGLARVFQDDPLGTGEVLCVDDGGPFEIAPEAKVGDRYEGLAGALETSGGEYRLQLLQAPRWVPTSSQQAADLDPQLFQFSVATFNLADLFDAEDDPFTEDTVLSASEYQRRLQKRALAIHNELGEPDLIAVQEVENLAVLQALAARPEIEADYEAVWVDSPDARGIDVALLARTDRVQVLGSRVHQGCTSLADGLGPDGNRDMENPQNAISCDTDGDGDLDGNRLFSRPPLEVEVRICQFGCSGSGELGDWPKASSQVQVELRLLVNHWKSKVEDSDTSPYTLPRRIEQARFAAGLVQEILAAQDVNLVLLGDLNDFPTSQPLELLVNEGLRDLWAGVQKGDRYSFIYQGVSQVLDYVLVHSPLPQLGSDLIPVHINADYPASLAGSGETAYRSSDHDPLLARFVWLGYQGYLPVVWGGE